MANYPPPEAWEECEECEAWEECEEWYPCCPLYPIPLEWPSVCGTMKSARSSSEVKATPAATQRALIPRSDLFEMAASSLERNAAKPLRILGMPFGILLSGAMRKGG